MLTLGTGAVAQPLTSPACFVTAFPLDIRREGLAEKIAPLEITCDGYDAQNPDSAPALVRVTLNTRLANRETTKSDHVPQAPTLTISRAGVSDATIHPDDAPGLREANVLQWTIPPQFRFARREVTETLFSLQNIRVAPGTSMPSVHIEEIAPTNIVATVTILDAQGRLLTADTLPLARAIRSVRLRALSPEARASCNDGGLVLHARLTEASASFFNVADGGGTARPVGRPQRLQPTSPVISLGLAGIPEGYYAQFPSSLTNLPISERNATPVTKASLMRVENVRTDRARALYAITVSSSDVIDSFDIAIHLVWRDDDSAPPELNGSIALRFSWETAPLDDGEPSGKATAIYAPGPHQEVQIAVRASCWTHLLYPVVTTKAGFDTILLLTDPAGVGERLRGVRTCDVTLFKAAPDVRSSDVVTRSVPLPAHGQASISVLHDVLSGSEADPRDFGGYAVASCPVDYAVGTGAVFAEGTDPVVISSVYYASRISLPAPPAYTADWSGEPLVSQAVESSVHSALPPIVRAAVQALEQVPVPARPTNPDAFAESDPNKSADGLPPHAETHSKLGSDPVTPDSIGALAAESPTVSTVDPLQPALTVRGAPNQAVALQEWRTSEGTLVANVTAQGSAYFSEMGLAAKPGQNSAALFFETDGVRRFALSASADRLRFIRYYPNGSARDIPVELQETGELLVTLPLHIGPDVSPGNGITIGPGYVDLPLRSAPPAPPPGFARLYADASAQSLSVITSPGILGLLPAEESAVSAEKEDASVSRGVTLAALAGGTERGALAAEIASGPLAAQNADAIRGAPRVPLDPVPHASTHRRDGSDPILPSAIGAAPNVSAVVSARDLYTAALTVFGSPGQSAGLQTWRDGGNGLAAVVTSQGSAFFREMGLAAPPGVRMVSLSYATPGHQPFKMLSEDGKLEVGVYAAGREPAVSMRLSADDDVQFPQGFSVYQAFAYTAVRHGYIDIPIRPESMLVPPDEGLRMYGTAIPDALTQVGKSGSARLILFGEDGVNPNSFCREVSLGIGTGANNLSTPWQGVGGEIVCDSVRMPVRP